MRAWPGTPPQVDPGGDLGVWVAALGGPGAGETRGRLVTLTLAEAPSSRTLRLACDAGRPRPATASRSARGVVFDGVLWNRTELWQQLGPGTGPLPNDAELVLLAHQRWGEGFVQRINGIFALVAWDGRNDVLVCARDRTGVYPLFYAALRDGLLVSTSIDAVLGCEGVASTIDRTAVAGHLINHWSGPEDTYFTAVKRLPAGCSLERRDGTTRVSSYWDPVPVGQPVRWIREDELEQFDALFEQAVARCVGLGRTTIYLSGGIDSVAVATVAADLCRRDGQPLPMALLMNLAILHADETPIQTAVARSLGLPHVMGRYEELGDPETVLQEALEWSGVWPWPLPYPSTLAWVNFARVAKEEGCRVLLTGEGGDEWLAVHPLYGAELLRRGDFLGFARLVAMSWKSYPLKPWMWTRLYGWRFSLRPVLAHPARRFMLACAPNALRARRQQAILAQAPQWALPDPSLRRALEERVARDVDRDLRGPRAPGIYLPAMRLMLDTRFDDDFERARRTGMRILHPFWDADLVDFLYRVPPSLWSRGGLTKGLVRPWLARRFPALGFENQRKLVLPNIDRDLVLERAQVAWEKHGGAPTLAALGIVDEVRLQAAMERFFAGQASRFGWVWHVLNLEAWARARVS